MGSCASQLAESAISDNISESPCDQCLIQHSPEWIMFGDDNDVSAGASLNSLGAFWSVNGRVFVLL